MPPRLLELGELKVTSTSTKQSLYLSCSVTLELPDSTIDEQIDAVGLAGMTRSGRLWIAKAATSRLVMKSSSISGVRFAEGEEASTPGRAVVDAFGRCPVWDDLSLKLREEYFKLIDEEEGTAYASFIINHPDLSSEFLSPENIPCAQVVTVTCDVCYGKKPKERTAARAYRKRKRDKREHDRQEGPTGLWDNLRTPIGFYHEDTTEDEEQEDEEKGRTRPRKRKDGTLKTQPARVVPDTQTAQQAPQIDMGPEAARKDISLLIKSALSKLLGLKNPTRGARVVRNLPCPSLIELAPAVFNIRYLQAFTSRAEHIPYIASCLSGLDAESPSLRAKIRALAEGEDDLDPVAELERRLHMLVQRGLDVPAVAPKRGRGKGATVEESQQPGKLHTPDWDTPQLEDLSQPPDDFSQQGEEFSQHPEGFSQQDEDLSLQKGQVPDEYGWVAGEQQGLLDELEDEFEFSLEAEYSKRPESATSTQDRWEQWNGDESVEDRQQPLEAPQDKPCVVWPYLDRPGYRRSQQPSQYWQQPHQDDEQPESPQPAGREWLDLSRARVILDEDGQPMPLAFEDLDLEEFEYELIPLGSDELIPLGSEA